MKKHIKTMGKNTYFYLGKTEDGYSVYMDKASFDCEWYWGFGYLKFFKTQNEWPISPYFMHEWTAHTHFNLEILNKGWSPDAFHERIPESPLTDKEIWTLMELMQTYYVLSDYMKCCYTGGVHITTNPAYETLKDENHYKNLIEVKIPTVIKEVEKLLTPNEEVTS